MKKIIFLFMLVFYLIGSASAHFVCGIVHDSFDTSASWFEVKAYYPTNLSQFVSCEVSPKDNKYCCDVSSIPGSTWQIGKMVMANVFDIENGYYAGPVSIITTGEGYDIMPDMNLSRIVEIYNPHKLVVSNFSDVLLNASFVPFSNSVKLFRENESVFLCENCSNYSSNIFSKFGINLWNFSLDFENFSFYRNFSFSLVNSINLNRTISCSNCRDNFVRSGSIVEMNVNIILSDEVRDLEFKEYVPLEWEILSTDGEIRDYTSSHRVIVWNVSGKSFSKQYSLKAPSVFIFPKEYFFKSELEDYFISEDKVFVYWWFRFFSTSSEFSSLREVEQPSKINIINPLNPFVKNDFGSIVSFAVFPKKEIKDAHFNLINENFEGEFKGVIEGYVLDTNVPIEDIDKVFIEFKIEKDLLENYENLDIFVFDSSWNKFEGEIYNEDSNFLYYRSFFKSVSKIVFVTERKKFLGLF